MMLNLRLLSFGVRAVLIGLLAASSTSCALLDSQDGRTNRSTGPDAGLGDTSPEDATPRDATPGDTASDIQAPHEDAQGPADTAPDTQTPSTNTGVIIGKVSFAAQTDLSIIEVSIPDCSHCDNTHADSSGNFRFDEVPAGTYDVFARAPYYPTQKLGSVTLSDGDTQTLAAYQMSLYRPLLHPGGLNGTFSFPQRNAHPAHPNKKAGLVTFTPQGEGDPQYFALDYQSGALKHLTNSRDWVLLSPSGKYFYVVGVKEIKAGVVGSSQAETFSLGGTHNTIDSMHLTLEGDTLIVAATQTGGDAYVHIISVSTSSTFSQKTYSLLDILDNATQSIFLHVRKPETPNETHWLRVDQRGIVTVTGVQSVGELNFTTSLTAQTFRPIVYGVEDCNDGPRCFLRVLTADTNDARLVGSRQFIIGAGGHNIMDSAGSWLAAEGNARVQIINAESGQYQDVARIQRATFSSDGEHVLLFNEYGKLFVLKSAAVPMEMEVIDEDIDADYVGSWVSPSVAFIANNASSQLYRIDGMQTATVDSYVTNSLQVMPGAGAIWKSSEDGGKFIVHLGDGPALALAPRQAQSRPFKSSLAWILTR